MFPIPYLTHQPAALFPIVFATLPSVLGDARVALASIAPAQAAREPSLKSASYMLELAEKALATGNDPGDIKSNLQSLLAAAEVSSTSVVEALAEAQSQLNVLEGILSEDLGMAPELGAIDQAIAAVRATSKERAGSSEELRRCGVEMDGRLQKTLCAKITR